MAEANNVAAQKFPTNPINALEARGEKRRQVIWLILFPTNPINALEASKRRTLLRPVIK